MERAVCGLKMMGEPVVSVDRSLSSHTPGASEPERHTQTHTPAVQTLTGAAPCSLSCISRFRASWINAVLLRENNQSGSNHVILMHYYSGITFVYSVAGS